MSSLLEKFIKHYGRLPTEFDPDYLEFLNMSKYRVLPNPDIAPGKCANCGSAKEGRKYIDFQLTIEWYGAVFLCSICLDDIARTVGLYNEMLDEIRLLRVQLLKLDSLKSQGVSLHDTVLKTFEELKEYYARLDSTIDHSNSTSSDSVPSTEKSSVESGTSTTESSIVGKEQRTTESDSSTGRKNLPSLAELLEAGSTQQ